MGYNIKMDLQEVGCGFMDWIDLAHGMDRWRWLVNVVMHVLVPLNAGNFLTGWEPVSFSRRTLLHGVSYQMNSFRFLYKISFLDAFVTELWIGTISRKCLSVCLSVRPKGTVRLLLDGFSWSFYFGFVLDICGHITILVKLEQNFQTLYVKTCTFVVSSFSGRHKWDSVRCELRTEAAKKVQHRVWSTVIDNRPSRYSEMSKHGALSTACDVLSVLVHCTDWTTAHPQTITVNAVEFGSPDDGP